MGAWTSVSLSLVSVDCFQLDICGCVCVCVCAVLSVIIHSSDTLYIK